MTKSTMNMNATTNQATMSVSGNRWTRSFRRLLVCSLLAAAAPACQTADGPAYELDTDVYSFETEGSLANLSAEEQETYQSDLRYMHSLMQPGTTVVMNHADARQHRFALARLKIGGKTPENAPQQFRAIEELRATHIKMGYTSGEVLKSQSNTFSDLHEISSNKTNFAANTIESLATTASAPDAWYTFWDLATYDANGTYIGPIASREVYARVPYGTLVVNGDLSLADGSSEIFSDSWRALDIPGVGYVETYTMARRPPPGQGITHYEPVITNPVDGGGSECFDICLNRTWTGDCDEDLTTIPGALAIPLSGSVTLSPPSSNMWNFDIDRIQEFASGTAVDAGGSPTSGGQIKVVLTDVGAGCNVDANNAILFDMEAFWSSVTVSPDGDTMSWDLLAMFDESCRQVQDEVILSMNFVLPVKKNDNTKQERSRIYLTNDPNSEDPDFPCITITNSCLAEGTMIQLADGDTTAIESIDAGDVVYNPFNMSSNSLTVMDTSKGYENVPMVRIEDDADHSLLMTEMHPIEVVGKGMVMAKYLQVGDVVATQSGPRPLIRVTREKYDGKVYNLKVGSDDEFQSLANDDQTVMYANGFLVGDGQIQSKYESLERAAAARPQGKVRDNLAAKWHHDYIHSARRHK